MEKGVVLKLYLSMLKLLNYYNMINIVWAKIPEYDNYEINNLGEVRKISSNKILKQHLSDGCKAVCLSGKRYYVHRLVAETFIPNPSNYRFVIHKDGDINNNAINNLLWVKGFDNYKIANRHRQIKIIKINILTKTFKVYKSIITASKDTNISRPSIRNSILKNDIIKNCYFIEYRKKFNINDFIKEKGLTYPNKTVKLI